MDSCHYVRDFDAYLVDSREKGSLTPYAVDA